MLPLARFVIGFVERRQWISIAFMAVLQAAERILVTATTVFLVDDHRLPAFVTGVALAAIVFLRGAARALTRASLETVIQRRVGAALLSRNVVQAAPLRHDEALSTVLEAGHQVSRIASELAPGAAGDLVASIALVAVVHRKVAPATELIALVALGVAATAAWASRRVASRASEDAWGAHGGVIDRLAAAIVGRAEILANGNAASFVSELDRALGLRRARVVRADGAAGFATRAPTFVALAAAGTWFALSPSSPALGELLVVATASAGFAGIARAAVEIARALPQVRALMPIFEGTVLPTGGTRAVRELSSLACSAVSYHYGDQDRALPPTTLVVKRGAAVLLVGPNGSGKSTLLRVVAGLVEPTAGTVSLDGTDLFSCDLDAWRGKLAFLPQRPLLPERASIRRAFELVHGAVTDERIEKSLRDLEVWQALAERARSPLDVELGELSVGQRQRVALARAFAADRPALLFDEPDASLDRAGIQLLARLLEREAATKLVIVAAHSTELVERLAAGCFVTADLGASASPLVDEALLEQGRH